MPVVAERPPAADNRRSSCNLPSMNTPAASSEDAVNISLVSIEKEGLVRLASAGSITAGNFDPSGKNPLERILGQNWSGFRVLLDMKGTTYIDSSAIGWLISSHKQIKAAGGILVLHDVPPSIRSMLDLLHVGKVVPMTDNVESARNLANGGHK